MDDTGQKREVRWKIAFEGNVQEFTEGTADGDIRVFEGSCLTLGFAR